MLIIECKGFVVLFWSTRNITRNTGVGGVTKHSGVGLGLFFPPNYYTNVLLLKLILNKSQRFFLCLSVMEVVL